MNTYWSLAAKVNHRAMGYKACCGGKAYELAAICEFCKLRPDKFDIYVDDELLY